MVNRFCTCMIKWKLPNGTYRMVEDIQTFPNPDKRPDASNNCIQRARNLRSILNRPKHDEVIPSNKIREVFGIPQDSEVIVEPTVLTQIFESDWEQHRGV